MDDNGSIGMAYAVSSASVYPSLGYTGRNASDPLGQMTFTETIAIAGTSSFTQSAFYGDYSQTTLDPTDGITFWHTGEYISGGQRTRVFSWQIPNLSISVQSPDLQTALTVFQNENTLNVKANRLPGDGETQVDLFDILGKQISSKKVFPAGDSFETSIDISGL